MTKNQKAEIGKAETGKFIGQPAEVGGLKAESSGPRSEMVFPVPAGEQEFLATLMQFMRSAKRCPDRGVARAARRWETAIGFRIRMSLQERGRVPGRSGQGGAVKRRAAL